MQVINIIDDIDPTTRMGRSISVVEHDDGTIYRSVYAVTPIGPHGRCCTPAGIERADGLALAAAERTAAYLIERLGATLQPRAGRFIVGAGPTAALDAIAEACARHGFGLVRAADRISIDAGICEREATPETRRALIEQLADRADVDAARAWTAATAAGEPADDLAREREEAANSEYGWCAQQTIAFLRRRAGVS